jgi:hypothetical protein
MLQGITVPHLLRRIDSIDSIRNHVLVTGQSLVESSKDVWSWAACTVSHSLPSTVAPSLAKPSKVRFHFENFICEKSSRGCCPATEQERAVEQHFQPG